MERIINYFKEKELKKEIKKLEREKVAILSLIKDKTWNIRDPYVLGEYKRTNDKINTLRTKLGSHETR